MCIVTKGLLFDVYITMGREMLSVIGHKQTCCRNRCVCISAANSMSSMGQHQHMPNHCMWSADVTELSDDDYDKYLCNFVQSLSVTLKSIDFWQSCRQKWVGSFFISRVV